MIHPVGFLVIFAVTSAVKHAMGEKSLAYWYLGLQVVIWILFGGFIALVHYFAGGSCA